MTVMELDKVRAEAAEAEAQGRRPLVTDDDTAAGGSWNYTAKAWGAPNIEFLRDNFYSLFRVRHD